MTRKLLLIANNFAGRGSALSLMQQAKREIWGYDCYFHLTESKTDVEKLFQSNRVEDFEAVICFGGDGTANSLLEFVIDKDVVFIPIPTGSANDISLELGVPGDWEHITSHLQNRKVKKIDTLEVNGIPFLTVGGLGIGSKLVDEYNTVRSKYRLGSMLLRRFKNNIYKILAAKNILVGAPSYNFNFKADVSPYNVSNQRRRKTSYKFSMKSEALFVSNQTYLAGNMRVSHESLNSDGVFELLVLPSRSRGYLLNALKAMTEDRLLSDMKSLRCLDLYIFTEKKIDFYGDGEILCRDNEFVIRLHHKSVTVLDFAREIK